MKEGVRIKMVSYALLKAQGYFTRTWLKRCSTSYHRDALCKLENTSVLLWICVLFCEKSPIFIINHKTVFQ